MSEVDRLSNSGLYPALPIADKRPSRDGSGSPPRGDQQAPDKPSPQTAETTAILQYRIAEIGHWYEPDKLMGYFVALYFGKLLVWDKVLGLGTTDPLAGFASVTSNLVVSFYFAKRGFENIARIIKR